MAVNRRQKGLINSCIALRTSRLYYQKNVSNTNTKCFLVILIEIFNSENNNVSQVTLTYQKYKEKVKKRYYRLCSNCPLRNPICYYLSFVFPANIICLLHCSAMHFNIVRSFKFILKVGVEDSIVNVLYG
jgi:hypothetical protein